MWAPEEAWAAEEGGWGLLLYIEFEKCNFVLGEGCRLRLQTKSR